MRSGTARRDGTTSTLWASTAHQVQALLKKAAGLDMSMICPLHGPVLSENLEHYIGLYDTWSSYKPETSGVFIAYASVYGNTKQAAEIVAGRC